MKKIGLALGSGGARGLAHITIFEAFEELGIFPSIISGTSVGAVIGAAIAAGFSTKEIKESIYNKLLSKTGNFWEVFKNSDFKKILDFVDVEIKPGGILKGEKFLSYLSEEIGIEKFEELKIPLSVVATNLYTREQAVFDSGDLYSAVKASYSLPGIFTPVTRNKYLYVDGGLVNPLPFDIIKEKCDVVVGINVLAKSKFKTHTEMPPAYEVLFSTFQIMQNSILSEKLKHIQPDILINTDIEDVRVFEFMKAEYIYKESKKYKSELKKKLEKFLR